MRWKLLVLVSVAASLLGFGLWAAVTITLFGSARELAQRDWLLPASALIPIGVIVLAAIFLYRHTARRRKTQAVITAVLGLLFVSLSYIVATKFFPEHLSLPPTSELRHAR
jgi:L-lactate permease